MSKGPNFDPHQVYCSVVDAIEAGQPVILAHEHRGVIPDVAALALAGAENAAAQLTTQDFSTEPDVQRHLDAVIAANELVAWYIADAPLARAHQQAGYTEVSSDLQLADISSLMARQDMDGSLSFSGHTLGNSLRP